jgi:hypothetical protein
LRYRRSALHPALHPGIEVQLPLVLEIEGRGKTRRFVLNPETDSFKSLSEKNPPLPRGRSCRAADPAHRSFDLRIP